MPYHDLFPFMYIVYIVAGAGFLLVVSAVVVWLFLARVRRGSPSQKKKLVGQEFIWTLVPALVLLGLTIAGEIPRGWVRLTAGLGGAEVQDRLK